MNLIDRHYTNTPQLCYTCCTSNANIPTCHYQQMGVPDAAARLASGVVHPSIEVVGASANSTPARRHSAPKREFEPQRSPIAQPQAAAGSLTQPQAVGSPSVGPVLAGPQPSPPPHRAPGLAAAPPLAASAASIAALRADFEAFRAASLVDRAQQAASMREVLTMLAALHSAAAPVAPPRPVAVSSSPIPAAQHGAVLERAYAATASASPFGALVDDENYCDDEAREVLSQSDTRTQPAAVVLPAASLMGNMACSDDLPVDDSSMAIAPLLSPPTSSSLALGQPPYWKGFNNSDLRSCFAIACMQLLFSVRAFTEALFTVQQPARRPTPLSTAVANLFQLHCRSGDDTVVDIVPFVAEATRHMSTSRQLAKPTHHDVHEFLVGLLSGLKEEGNDERSLADCFYWRSRESTVCVQCNHMSEGQDAECSTISLSLPNATSSDSDHSIASLLVEHFAAKEVQYRCDAAVNNGDESTRCTCATRRRLSNIASTPDVLLVHLKRAVTLPSPTVSAPTLRRSARRATPSASPPASPPADTVTTKSARVVHLPLQLDLKAHCWSSDTSVWYDLVGIVLHKGEEATTGHYVVDIINPSTPSTWTRYDDSNVTHHPCEPVYHWVTEATVVAYRRREQAVATSRDSTTVAALPPPSTVDDLPSPSDSISEPLLAAAESAETESIVQCQHECFCTGRYKIPGKDRTGSGPGCTPYKAIRHTVREHERSRDHHPHCSEDTCGKHMSKRCSYTAENRKRKRKRQSEKGVSGSAKESKTEETGVTMTAERDTSDATMDDSNIFHPLPKSVDTLPSAPSPLDCAHVIVVPESLDTPSAAPSPLACAHVVFVPSPELNALRSVDAYATVPTLATLLYAYFILHRVDRQEWWKAFDHATTNGLHCHKMLAFCAGCKGEQQWRETPAVWQKLNKAVSMFRLSRRLPANDMPLNFPTYLDWIVSSTSSASSSACAAATPSPSAFSPPQDSPLLMPSPPLSPPAPSMVDPPSSPFASLEASGMAREKQADQTGMGCAPEVNEVSMTEVEDVKSEDAVMLTSPASPVLLPTPKASTLLSLSRTTAPSFALSSPGPPLSEAPLDPVLPSESAPVSTPSDEEGVRQQREGQVQEAVPPYARHFGTRSRVYMKPERPSSHSPAVAPQKTATEEGQRHGERRRARHVRDV